MTTALVISQKVSIPYQQIEFTSIRSQGAGGQNVNKVSTAIHLFFDIEKSSLPEFYKTRLLNLNDRRISKEGQVVIKAQANRTREKNKQDALQRLQKLIQSVAVVKKKRVESKPTQGAQKKRVENKVKRGQLKQMRRKVREE